MSAPRTLVVSPTYNERDNLAPFVSAVLAALPQADLLIVDDASPDGTGALADALALREPRLRVLHRRAKAGLGRAYLAGFRLALAAGYDRVIQMDADFSHDPKDLPRLLAASEGADLVLGSRYSAGGGRVLNWPLRRLFLSYGAGLYVRLLTRLPVMDPTGGYKCFRRAVLQAVLDGPIAAEGYAFQIETTYHAWRKGFRIVELPIVFADRAAGVSKMSLAIAWEAIFLVLRLAFRHR